MITKNFYTKMPHLLIFIFTSFPFYFCCHSLNSNNNKERIIFSDLIHMLQLQQFKEKNLLEKTSWDSSILFIEYLVFWCFLQGIIMYLISIKVRQLGIWQIIFQHLSVPTEQYWVFREIKWVPNKFAFLQWYDLLQMKYFIARL